MNSETDRWIIERKTKRKNERKIDRSINRSGQSIAASQDPTKKRYLRKGNPLMSRVGDILQ